MAKSNTISTTPALIPDLPQQGLGSIFLRPVQTRVDRAANSRALGFGAGQEAVSAPRCRIMRGRPVRSFVIGMLLFIISFPVVLILLILTTIAILLPLALHLDGVALVAGALLGLIDIGVIGVFYFTAIFIARAVVGLGVGRLILQVALGRDQARRSPRLSVLIGVALLSLLASLPVVGFLFNAGALFMGLGAIAGATLDGLQKLRLRQLRDAEPAGYSRSSAPSAQPAEAAPAAVAPIALPPVARGVGLDDLPEGFDPGLFFEED